MKDLTNVVIQQTRLKDTSFYDSVSSFELYSLTGVCYITSIKHGSAFIHSFYFNSIYLCLFFALLHLRWCTGSSVVAERRDYSPVAVCRRLIASLVA